MLPNTIKSSDKTKVARVIADMLGVENADKMQPEQAINTGLRVMKNKKMTPELMSVLKKMLGLATEVGVRVDHSLVKEAMDAYDGTVDVMQPAPIVDKKVKYKSLMKKAAHHMDNYDEDPHTETGNSLEDKKDPVDDDQLRRRKVDYKMSEERELKDEDGDGDDDTIEDIVDDELEDIDDKDLDKMADEVDDEDDVMDAYEDDEMSIVDSETGDVEKEEIDESMLMEVLSKTERMRARFRFMKSKSKRARKLQIALHKRSDAKTLAKRARKLAIKMLKERIMKKKISELSLSDKERVEAIVAKRQKAVNRLAMRLLPKIRKIENERLTHEKVTKNE